MRTVIEYAEFTQKAEKVFGKNEIDKIVSFLSDNPKAGKSLERFGGIRKVEWQNNTEYSIYFHPGSKNLPLVIITVFRKGEKLIFDKIIEILIRSKIG